MTARVQLWLTKQVDPKMAEELVKSELDKLGCITTPPAEWLLEKEFERVEIVLLGVKYDKRLRSNIVLALKSAFADNFAVRPWEVTVLFNRPLRDT